MKNSKFAVIGITAMWIFAIVICAIDNMKVKPTATVEVEVEAETEIITKTALEPCTKPNREWVSVIEPTTEIVTEEPTTTFKGYDIPLSLEIQERILTISEKYGVAELLIYAIIKTESNFKFVTGDSGRSIGYMQIQPRWWSNLANQLGLNIYDKGDNIELGVAILTTLLGKYGNDLTMALKAYNGGKPNGNNDWYATRVYKNYLELENVIYE